MNRLPIPENYKPERVEFPTADMAVALEIASKRRKKKKKDSDGDTDASPKGEKKDE